jgi:hypothetical protein
MSAAARLRILRGAACLLLSAIALDLIADAGCDAAFALAPATAVVRAQDQGQPGDREACSSVCVPDCFCCSSSVAAGAVIVLPPPVLVRSFGVPARERWPEGFRLAVDRPPLLVA